MARPRKPHCIENHGDDPPRDGGGHCRLCRREYQRARRAAGLHGRGNRPAHRKRDKARKRAAIAAYRDERGCQRCGASENLHLHHRDPTTKVAAISELVDDRASWARILAELMKCDVLCADCHMAHHHPNSAAARRASSAWGGDDRVMRTSPGRDASSPTAVRARA